MALLGVLTVVVALSLSRAAAQQFVEDLRRGIRSQAAFVKGKALYDSGDYEGARERFLESLTLDANHDEARALLGWSQHFLGEYRAAIISFKAALRRQPAWEGLHNGMGWSRFRLKRYHLAVEAFRHLNLEGFARVDFFVERGTSRIYLNEVNTLPGFTPISMFPKLWEASGLSYPRLVERLVMLGLESSRSRGRRVTRLAR